MGNCHNGKHISIVKIACSIKPTGDWTDINSDRVHAVSYVALAHDYARLEMAWKMCGS